MTLKERAALLKTHPERIAAARARGELVEMVAFPRHLPVHRVTGWGLLDLAPTQTACGRALSPSVVMFWGAGQGYTRCQICWPPKADGSGS